MPRRDLRVTIFREAIKAQEAKKAKAKLIPLLKAQLKAAQAKVEIVEAKLSEAERIKAELEKTKAEAEKAKQPN